MDNDFNKQQTQTHLLARQVPGLHALVQWLSITTLIMQINKSRLVKIFKNEKLTVGNPHNSCASYMFIGLLVIGHRKRIPPKIHRPTRWGNHYHAWYDQLTLNGAPSLNTHTHTATGIDIGSSFCH